MNSNRTVPVSLSQIEQALEEVWTRQNLLQDNEYVNLYLIKGKLEARISSQKEVVEVLKL